MDLARNADRLLHHALALPGAWEDHPWGERVAKVGAKVFLFFGHDHRKGEQLTLAVKLPQSGVAALDRPECKPTGYGLGKSGWVTAKYQRGDDVPIALVEAWIVESWTAVAPKKLVKARALGAGAATHRPDSRTAPTSKSNAEPKPESKPAAKPAAKSAQGSAARPAARGTQAGRTSGSRRASSRKARPR